MELRIIHVDNPNISEGVFVVQRRNWGVWQDMFYNEVDATLHTDMELGNSNIDRFEFEDFHVAKAAAERFRQSSSKRITHEVWRM